MNLTPEERQRIYDEERALLDERAIRRQARRELLYEKWGVPPREFLYEKWGVPPPLPIIFAIGFLVIQTCLVVIVRIRAWPFSYTDPSFFTIPGLYVVFAMGFIWKILKRRNWVRILFYIYSLLNVALGVYLFISLGRESGWGWSSMYEEEYRWWFGLGWGLVSLGLAIPFLPACYLLTRKASNDWFRPSADTVIGVTDEEVDVADVDEPGD